MSIGTSPNGKRVLVVETDDLILGLIVRWLTEAGYVVAGSEPLAEGLALVIADVPDPAQADVARKESWARDGVPVLAISGRFRREPAALRAVARRLGVARALPKPFSCDELLAAVEECLGGR